MTEGKNIGLSILVGLGIGVAIIIIVGILFFICNAFSYNQPEIVTKYVCDDGSTVSNPKGCPSCGDDSCTENYNECPIDCSASARNGKRPWCGTGYVYDADNGNCLKSGTTGGIYK